MGLDVVFDRELALAAGLEVKVLAINGEYEPDDDPAYIAWCKGSFEHIKIPGTDHYVVNDSCGVHDIAVQANPWGLAYKPLTEWLAAHGISWNEY